jgi:hypothetical protein
VEKVFQFKNKNNNMNKDKIDLYNFLVDTPYFSKEYVMGKIFNFSFSDIQYINNLELMEKRNKKIDDLLNED